MKAAFFFTIMMLFAGSLMSFSKYPNSTITYGEFGGDGYTAPKLILKEDYTFRYIDKTNKKSPIDITGSWKIVEDQLQLLDVNNKKVMTNYEITREGKCLKSSKGMAFYTLCNC